MKVALASDTHVPSRAGSIPGWVADELRAADHVIHAGDFDSADAYETVADLADGDLTAVAGNADPPDLDLPPTAVVELGGVTVVATHGHGSGRDTQHRAAEAVDAATGDPDAVGVYGHSHSVADADVEGTRLLNPGSATGAWPASETTMMVATVADGDLSVEVRRE